MFNFTLHHPKTHVAQLLCFTIMWESTSHGMSIMVFFISMFFNFYNQIIDGTCEGGILGPKSICTQFLKCVLNAFQHIKKLDAQLHLDIEYAHKVVL